MIKKASKLILGIETSCDETSAAVVGTKSYKLKAISFEILSNIVLSQIDIHKKYGGIVPEVAARNHVKNILPVIQGALDEARVTKKDIDMIAVTKGPGLITSLMVGVETARTLAYIWEKPIVPVNHIKAHIYAAWLSLNVHNSPHSPLTLRGEVEQVPPLKVRGGQEELLPVAKSYKLKAISFPALALVVSGGHTELVLMKNERRFKKIGQTLDDAAGEAFDKVAKILGLGYPGGPIISKVAENGNPKTFDFPRPMIKSGDFNFSFSGLKTSVLYTTYKLKAKSYKLKKDIVASFQQAVVDVLVFKTIKAAQQYKTKTLIMGGGVAANKLLRDTMRSEAEKINVLFVVPEIKLCTDNAAPICIAGYYGKSVPWQKIEADPQLEVE